MDLVTFGEGLIRISPPVGEGGAGLAAYVAGSELNVAVAATRLGISARWISCLPDNALGRHLDETARAHGVDTHIVWARDGRVGVYFLPRGTAPRQTGVVYDRVGSSFSLLTRDSIDWRTAFADARWFHVSGITPALSPGAADAVAAALGTAKAAGLVVSYDVNYRARLWDAERAREVQEPLLRHVDVLIVSRDDARTVFGVVADSVEHAGRSLADRFGLNAVVITDRESAGGACVITSGVACPATRYEVDVVERVGTGDAFSAGLITSRLQNTDWPEAVRVAAATAALKLTMPGDFFTGRRADVEGIMKPRSFVKYG